MKLLFVNLSNRAWALWIVVFVLGEREILSLGLSLYFFCSAS